jgi:formylglycine-generating enzyme required for sulfatase activity
MALHRLKIRRIFRVPLLLAALACFSPVAGAQSAEVPLSIDDIRTVLADEVRQADIISTVRERRIDFEVTTQVERELRDLMREKRVTHAEADELISALKEVERPPGPPGLIVQTQPALAAADVYVNGNSVGTTDAGGRLELRSDKNPQIPPLAPGQAVLMVSKDGYKDFETTITLVSGQVSTVPAELQRIPGCAPARAPTDEEKRMKWVFVPVSKGRFKMGCSEGYDNYCKTDERPHNVQITNCFELAAYPVTQAMWKSVMGENPSHFRGDDRPVETVSWDDAQKFLAAMNARNDGYHYRLPSEAEWEYAARADTIFPRYENLDDIGWYAQNSGKRRIPTEEIGSLWPNPTLPGVGDDPSNYVLRLLANGNETHDVGQQKPNSWQLYDMLGNVWQWVSDWYDKDYYSSSPLNDPAGPSSGQFRVMRGGSWSGTLWTVRVSARNWLPPASSSDNVGFRCVREPAP